MTYMDQRLEPLMKSILQEGVVGASILVQQGGKTLAESYYGYADGENLVPVAPDTIFRLHSMTKLFTCTAALMLMERGLYLLSDPLYEYMPQFRNMTVTHTDAAGGEVFQPAKKPILVRDLFTMSTGITRRDERCAASRAASKLFLDNVGDKGLYDYRFTNQDFAREIAKAPLAFEPGSHFLYGLSHDLLGAFIEVLSSLTLGEFLKKEILDPLGLKDTFFRIPEEKRCRLSKTYRKTKDGSVIENTEYEPRHTEGCPYESGAAGLLSTITDYTRFADTLTNGGTSRDGVRLLSRKTVELMRENHLSPAQLEDFSAYKQGYGYGLGVRTLMNRVPGGVNGSIGEFGWSGLAGTWQLMDPVEDLTVTYMQQLISAVPMPDFHSRIRTVVYGAL